MRTRPSTRASSAARNTIAGSSYDDATVEKFVDELLQGVQPDWLPILRPALLEDGRAAVERYMGVLEGASGGDNVFPKKELLLEAFRLTSLAQVRVVILGQDPYHNVGQACGLAFSVPRNCATPKLPPSLLKIYQEAAIKDCSHGDLSSWAKQGVLLLNPVLTVEAHKANSHTAWGWQKVTNRVLRELCAAVTERSLVFLLWGTKAGEKVRWLDLTRHAVLQAAHPSPLATRGGFIGCGHFVKANELLAQQGAPQIKWDSVLDPEDQWAAVPTATGLGESKLTPLTPEALLAINPVLPAPASKASTPARASAKRRRSSAPAPGSDDIKVDLTLDSENARLTSPPVAAETAAALAVADSAAAAEPAAAALATVAAAPAEVSPVAAPETAARALEETLDAPTVHAPAPAEAAEAAQGEQEVAAETARQVPAPETMAEPEAPADVEAATAPEAAAPPEAAVPPEAAAEAAAALEAAAEPASEVAAEPVTGVEPAEPEAAVEASLGAEEAAAASDSGPKSMEVSAEAVVEAAAEVAVAAPVAAASAMEVAAAAVIAAAEPATEAPGSLVEPVSTSEPMSMSSESMSEAAAAAPVMLEAVPSASSEEEVSSEVPAAKRQRYNAEEETRATSSTAGEPAVSSAEELGEHELSAKDAGAQQMEALNPALIPEKV